MGIRAKCDAADAFSLHLYVVVGALTLEFIVVRGRGWGGTSVFAQDSARNLS